MTAARKLPDINDFQSKLDGLWRNNVSCEALHDQCRGPDSPKSIGVGSDISPSKILEFAALGFRHVVQDGNPFTTQELNISAAMIMDEGRFVREPLELIFDPTMIGAECGRYDIFRQDFSAARQKSEAVSKYDDVLKNHSVAASLRGDLINILDELFTNSIYNAPYTDANNENPGASRKENTIVMPQGKQGQIFSGTDGQRIAIGCIDPFGTLNVERLLRRVKNCYDTNVADNINFTDTGGAGIGSYMVFNSSTSYFAAVSSGEFTQICCVVPIKMSSRARQAQSKNLHWFEKKKEQSHGSIQSG